ncbi:hypothetical protein HDV00_008054 [Rhizophlyctis rosea]|nr:hypothetical protein HDV00_008054 [Rhizophlyctis rosea]
MGLISAVKAGLSSEKGQQDQQYSTGATAAPASSTTADSTVRCETQNAPVVKEHVHAREKEEITPVIEREREETIVNQVVQPVKDTRHEVHHHQATNAPIQNEVIEDISNAEAEKYQRNRAQHQSTRTVEGHGVHSAHVTAPIVHERVKPHVVEEIQPVIEREIQEEHVVHRIQPVQERVVKAPVVGETRYNAPISQEEWEARGGSAEGTGLKCERV